jgi:hypothetical protein
VRRRQFVASTAACFSPLSEIPVEPDDRDLYGVRAETDDIEESLVVAADDKMGAVRRTLDWLENTEGNEIREVSVRPNPIDIGAFCNLRAAGQLYMPARGVYRYVQSD